MEAGGPVRLAVGGVRRGLLRFAGGDDNFRYVVPSATTQPCRDIMNYTL